LRAVDSVMWRAFGRPVGEVHAAVSPKWQPCLKEKSVPPPFDSVSGAELASGSVEQATYGPREGLNPPPALR
jgi:hypothetical protein